LTPQGVPGFESLSLRHCPLRNFSLPQGARNFALVFKGYAGGLFTLLGARQPKSVSLGRYSLDLLPAPIWWIFRKTLIEREESVTQPEHFEAGCTTGEPTGI